MTAYVIGDVQGCYDELIELLEKIHFDGKNDQLYFTGDLVNRGTQSLEVMRFLKGLGKNAVTVLGNHDLHYLAVSAGVRQLNKYDTFQDVLAAPDQKILFDWMRHQSMIHYDKKNNFLLVHAGILPCWDIKTVLKLCNEVELRLQSQNYMEFLKNMMGNTPLQWSDNLNEEDRLRFVVNCLTRMRYIDKTNTLELNYKAASHGEMPGYYPWFTLPSKIIENTRVIFGHWASLQGKTNMPGVYALDTGCSWGNCLTALRLSDLHYFSVQCPKYKREGGKYD